MPPAGITARALRLALGLTRASNLPLNLAMLYFEWWIDQRGDPGLIKDWIVDGPGLYVWSFDPRYAQYLGPGRVAIAGQPKTSGPLGLGEYGWSDPASSVFPPPFDWNVQTWLPEGSKAFYSQTDVVVNEATPIRPPGNINRWISLDRGQPGFGALNAQTIVTYAYYAFSPTPTVQPRYEEGRDPKPQSWSFPQGTADYGFADNPIFLPVVAPAFTPQPRPIWWSPPRPFPPTPEWPDVGPRPNPEPDPEPNPYPEPEPWPNPNPDPEPWTDPTGTPGMPFGVAPNGLKGAVELSPFSPPRTVSPRGPKPPPKGTKERKGGLPPWAVPLWRSFGGPTEFADAVDALYEALPRKTKIAAYKRLGRQPKALERLGIIYDNLASLDIGKAIGNLVENHYEDKFYGKLGKLLGQASANTGRPIGLGTGPAL